MLCTPMSDRKHCMLWDGKTGWTKTQVNKDKHYKGGVAKWESSDSTVAIIFTGREDSNGYTERLKHNTRSKTWEWKTDSKKFSDFKNYHYFSSVTFDNYVYMFGGQIGDKGKVVNKAFRYDGTWHKDRNLVKPRHRHLSLVVGEKIVHFGGAGELPFEVWTSLGKGSWTDKKVESKMKLKDWAKNPNAFVIAPDDYQ